MAIPLSETSIILKVTLLSFFPDTKKPAPLTISELRQTNSMPAHKRTNSELQDMSKMGLLAKSGNGSHGVAYSMTKKGKIFLKKHSDKIITIDEFMKLCDVRTRENRKSPTTSKPKDINLSSHANSSIAGIVKLEEDRETLLRFLLSVESMISGQLDALIPERVQEQTVEP